MSASPTQRAGEVQLVAVGSIEARDYLRRSGRGVRGDADPCEREHESLHALQELEQLVGLEHCGEDGERRLVAERSRRKRRDQRLADAPRNPDLIRPKAARAVSAPQLAQTVVAKITRVHDHDHDGT